MQRWIDDDQPMQIQQPKMDEDEEDDNRPGVTNGHAHFIEHQIKQETGSS
jgi:hypothetical protein